MLYTLSSPFALFVNTKGQPSIESIITKAINPDFCNILCNMFLYPKDHSDVISLVLWNVDVRAIGEETIWQKQSLWTTFSLFRASIRFMCQTQVWSTVFAWQTCTGVLAALQLNSSLRCSLPQSFRNNNLLLFISLFQ